MNKTNIPDNIFNIFNSKTIDEAIIKDYQTMQIAMDSYDLLYTI